MSDINATIQLAVAEANQSYLNSGINIRLRLVDSFEIAYSETGKTFDQILADFVANPTVQNRRNTSGADLPRWIINQSDFVRPRRRHLGQCIDGIRGGPLDCAPAIIRSLTSSGITGCPT